MSAKKVNPKSSGEANLVAIDYGMAQIRWTRDFLSAQGDQYNNTLLVQYYLLNMGSYPVAKDLFMTDLCKKEVKVAFGPTTNMLADFFSRSMQGATFRRKRCHNQFSY